MKRANDQIPWPRKMHVEKFELQALLNYFVRPASGPNGPFLRGMQTREERKSLKAAMSTLGLFQAWLKSTREGQAVALPPVPVQVFDFPEANVNFLLKVMTDMDNVSGLTLVDFEERLEQLKAGTYVLPEDAGTEAPKALEEAPATAELPPEPAPT